MIHGLWPMVHDYGLWPMIDGLWSMAHLGDDAHAEVDADEEAVPAQHGGVVQGVHQRLWSMV